MRTPSVKLGTVIPLLVLACNDAPGPNPADRAPVTTGVPTVVAQSLVVDYDKKWGTFVITAHDPDTVVVVRCNGAFVGEGQQRLTLRQPFSLLRHHPYLRTYCELEAAGDSVVVAWADTTLPVPMDSTPKITWPVPSEPPRVNKPLLFSASGHDDWGIVSHSIFYAPGNDIYECTANWVIARTTSPSPPAREVTDTITLTFDTPGHYCIGFSARDDFHPSSGPDGHRSGAINYMVVAAE